MGEKSGSLARRTTKLAKDPSSTTCVATIAFARSAQKSATTTPTCIAVNTTRGVEPCCSSEPVVRSWRGSEMR